MNLYNLLPEHLKTKAISLEALGTNSYCWPLYSAIQILDLLEEAQKDIVILGGDLYTRIEETHQIKSLYSNWYYEPVTPFSSIDHTNSIKKAHKYLEEVANQNDARTILVDFVVVSADSTERPHS